MIKIKAFVNPEEWGLSFYAGIFFFLLALNILSPKGIIHWVLMKQEANRLENKVAATQKELSDLKEKEARFSQSDVAKMRAIREELGLLKSDEISLEFTDTKISGQSK